ncbi:GTPase required for pre-60S ribosomal subunit nuclear export and maturation, partial [Coemansia sp. RSA 2049]
ASEKLSAGTEGLLSSEETAEREGDEDADEKKGNNISLASFNVTQKFSKIPVAADYLPVDLEGDNELREAEKALIAYEEPNSAVSGGVVANVDDGNSVAATHKRKADDLEAEEVEEPDWDEVFQSAISENNKIADSELDSDFSSSESDGEDEGTDEGMRKEQDSAAGGVGESDIVEEKARGEQNAVMATGSSKATRMTTNKMKVGKHYYADANIKNRNRNKIRPVAPESKIKRMRKPGSWRVSKNMK